LMLMGEKPTYYDVRSDFWRRHFEMASDYETWLSSSNPEMARRWVEASERVPALTPDQVQRLEGYDREMNVLVYAGIWCGDCSRAGPMFRQITEACGEKVNLRVIDREASEELKEELRIVGATRVPILVFLSEDFWEVGRFGERVLTVYRAKATREIGRDYRGGILSLRALSDEQSEWVDIYERMLIMLRLSPPLRRRHGD
jgi:thiol-disulfide isomerase/thioredoxin